MLKIKMSIGGCCKWRVYVNMCLCIFVCLCVYHVCVCVCVTDMGEDT